ncbi:MAG: hypothetical protein Q7J98_12975 [Kiritimatiellia bacterium]|nr:hypothetical protein [Kiritimatiellia bacterium]
MSRNIAFFDAEAGQGWRRLPRIQENMQEKRLRRNCRKASYFVLGLFLGVRTSLKPGDNLPMRVTLKA